eukprot:6211143-Pleurochrysis_carterae.AAC.1
MPICCYCTTELRGVAGSWVSYILSASYAHSQFISTATPLKGFVRLRSTYAHALHCSVQHRMDNTQK